MQDHGEVFTNEREVNAMLDLVADECRRIESRFLEPACGNGNFIAEVLRRKFVAVSSIYGVDIMADNVAECRARLLGIVLDAARRDLRRAPDDAFVTAVRYVLEKNILCGDALTLKDTAGEPITFCEWSMVSGDLVKRRDFLLSELLEGHVDKNEQPALFGAANALWEFDDETQAYLPAAIREYPPMSYREVARVG